MHEWDVYIISSNHLDSFVADHLVHKAVNLFRLLGAEVRQAHDLVASLLAAHHVVGTVLPTRYQCYRLHLSNWAEGMNS